MALVENIKQLCEKRRIAVSELEEKAGLARNSIYKWNKHNPNVNAVVRVTRVLDTTVDSLIKEDN